MDLLEKLKNGDPLATVGTAVTFDQKGIINLVSGLAILAVIIILVIQITKKL